MKTKKIIIFTNSLWNVENFRIHLIKKLIKMKYNIYVIAPTSYEKSYLNDIGCNLISFNFNRKSINPISEFISIIKFLIICLKIKPNLLISFTIKPNIYSGIVSKLLFIKNITTFTGLGSSLIKKSFLSKFMIFVLYFSLKGPEHIFFQNKYDKEFLEKKIKYLKYKSDIAPGSGIDLKKFKYDQGFKKRKSEKIKILMISRILKDKGVYEFFSVAKKIQEKFVNTEFFYLGQFDDGNPSYIEKNEFNTLVNDAKVQYLGFDSEVDNHIIKSDIVVLPSHREGLPRSILEALAIGRPVIVSDAPGCIDLIFEEKNGFSFKTKNVDDFYIKLNKIINLNHNDRYNMGLIGRNIIENKYSEDIVTNMYLDKVRELLK